MEDLISEIEQIETYYNIKLKKIIETHDYTSQVQNPKNKNCYSVDLNNKICKLNLYGNSIDDLKGILNISENITHLNLSNNRIKSLKYISSFKNISFLDLGINDISDISLITNLTKLEVLYLDDNAIKFIPDLNLINLIDLYLNDNNIKELDNLSSLKSLVSLELSDNIIEDISPIYLLEKLSDLSLNNNKISNISGLDKLKNLSSVSIAENTVNNISVFSKIEKLESLNLSKNQIDDIDSLRQISINKELFISQNNIFDLSPLYDSLKKQKIGFLNAFENPLIYPPVEIVQQGEYTIVNWFDKIINNVKEKIRLAKSQNIFKLDIGNMGLTDLSMIPELFEFHSLKELIISNEWAEFNNKKNEWVRKESENNHVKNNIRNIPKEFSKLENLEKIILGGDWKSKKDTNYIKWRIKDISHLASLKKLSFLNLSNNNIEIISNILDFKDLEIVHLNNNNIYNIPNLSNLKKLKEIYLSNNNINNILFLQGCYQIETIDLHSNKISNLAPLEDLLINSDIKIKNSSWEKKCISISNNNADINPPYEILNLSKNDFLLYLKQLEYQAKLNLPPYYNREIKIILVGNSYSGKSTFLHYLKTKRIKKSLPSTHWLVTEELENIKIENEIFKLRFFDFGGQDYYHDTHKMFFSSDSVYLLLWDKKSNFLGRVTNERDKSIHGLQVFPLEYWLDSIKIFAKRSLSESQKQMEQLLNERDKKIKSIDKSNISNYSDTSTSIEDKNILIVQNKIDISKGFLNQQIINEKYNNIYEFINISIFEKKGLKQFNEHYIDLLKRNLNYKKPLLLTWGIIKDNFKDIFLSDNFIIDISVFKERINNYLTVKLKKNYNIPDDEIENIIFNNDEAILFANFLREIGLVIFDSKDKTNTSIIVNQNIFLEVIYEILRISEKNKGLIEEKDLHNIKNGQECIDILIKQNIIFKNLTNENYVSPLFLPENPNLLVNLLVDIKIPFRRFKFDGFIPRSIILSVFSKIVSSEDISDKDFYFWKKGLIIKNKNGQKILLMFDDGNDLGFAYIDIFNFEKNINTSFASKIIEIINDIIESDCNEYKELITLDGKNFVNKKILTTNYKNGVNYIKSINFNNKTHSYENIYKYNKFMDDKLKKPNKKLFISYSKQDEILVNNFIDHLSSLQSLGLIDSWYCTELKAGEDWDIKIKEKLNEADIVCFMISPKFMSTPYIHKYEVKQTFKRYYNGENVKIVPIILDFVDWSRTYTFETDDKKEITWSLDKFTALPFTGQEIKKFKNENMAWYIVEQALRNIIEEDLYLDKDEDDKVRKFSVKIRKLYEDMISDKV